MVNNVKQIEVKTSDGVSYFHGSWYRGEHTNFIPRKDDLLKPGALEKYILQGWEAPAIIKKDSKILSFGSCFAQNITKHLQSKGFNVLGKDAPSHIINFGEGIANTFSIVQQFEWAIENKNFDHLYWFGPNKEIAFPEEDERIKTKELIESADVFIFTLGVSEIWYDKVSGEAFWRAIPSDMFDDEIHGFRVSSVEENISNITKVISIIEKINPDAKIIITLSPVPLMATFRPISCLTASSVSKAILRVAIDEVVRKEFKNVYYFPSYEIVKEFFIDPMKPDNRHPKPKIIKKIMDVFTKNYVEQ